MSEPQLTPQKRKRRRWELAPDREPMGHEHLIWRVRSRPSNYDRPWDFPTRGHAVKGDPVEWLPVTSKQRRSSHGGHGSGND